MQIRTIIYLVITHSVYMLYLLFHIIKIQVLYFFARNIDYQSNYYSYDINK